MKMIFKKDGGEIIAFMPYDFCNWQGDFTCYAHIGQHGACSYSYYRKCKKATKEEYQELLNELKNIGYDVEIINRINAKEFRKAYQDFLAKDKMLRAAQNDKI